AAVRRNLQVPALLQFLSTRFTQPQNPHPSLFRDRERKPELGAIRGQDFHGAAKLLNHGLNQVKTRGSGAAKVDVLGQPGATVANDQGHTIAVLWYQADFDLAILVVSLTWPEGMFQRVRHQLVHDQTAG